jgi:hypothetical protein
MTTPTVSFSSVYIHSITGPLHGISSSLIGGIGPQGFQGPFGGPQGFQGLIGSTGPQGFQGLIGSTGPQGFQGLVGSTGSQGFQGFVGLTGTQGFVGRIGVQGFQGYHGPTGPYGGPPGPQGLAGPTGASNGILGPQGPPGISPVNSYNFSQLYYVTSSALFDPILGPNNLTFEGTGASFTKILRVPKEFTQAYVVIGCINELPTEDFVNPYINLMGYFQRDNDSSPTYGNNFCSLYLCTGAELAKRLSSHPGEGYFDPVTDVSYEIGSDVLLNTSQNLNLTYGFFVGCIENESMKGGLIFNNQEDELQPFYLIDSYIQKSSGYTDIVFNFQSLRHAGTLSNVPIYVFII